MHEMPLLKTDHRPLKTDKDYGNQKLTPTSPARRYQTYLTRDELTVGAEPEKSLLEPKKRISGRNNDGRITVRRRGGGHKRFTASLISSAINRACPDASRKSSTIRIARRTSRSSPIWTAKRYIIAPTGLEVGKMVMSGAEADILPGNALPIRNIPLGTQIHNIELRPGKGGQMARSAGAFAQLVAKKATTHSFVCRRRNPSRAGCVHGDNRAGRQYRARKCFAR
jgi:large subunit ribosomal protein L2